MANTYSVAISYHSDLGWIDYDGDKKKAEVHLANAEGKKLTEDWLQHKNAIRVPQETLMDFTEETGVPRADVGSVKVALTRLWNNTQVTVDWSRPVDYVKAHPHY